MIENKKIEQDLKEIDIRIHDLKVNRAYDFKNSAISILSGGAIVGFVGINRELEINILVLTLLGGLVGLNIFYSAITMANAIVDKGEQIRNLEYLKKCLKSYDLSRLSIDKIDNKLATMKENDKKRSNLEFLKHYLQNNSLSHDDMNYKRATTKCKK